VFSFPEGTHELVNLTNARYLVTGDERAEQPQRVKKYYELSQEPYSDSRTATQLFMVLAALIGPFAMIWILASQLGAPDSTVSFGLLSLLAGLGGVAKRLSLERMLVSIVVLLPLPLLLLVIAVLVSPLIAGALLILLLVGFSIMPLLTQVLKFSDRIARSFSRLLLKLGLMGYETPVLEYTASGYRTREYSKLDAVDEDNIYWHTFLGRKFGFTFAPNESVWNNEIVDRDAISNRAEAVTDGGTMKQDGERKLSGSKTNIPSGYTRIPERSRAVYGTFVPSRLKRSHYYVSVGKALERFTHVATGEKSHNRLGQAKEEFGGGSSMDTAAVAKLSAAMGIVSFLLGILIFLVPVFL